MEPSQKLLVVAATMFEIRPFADRLLFVKKEDEQLSSYIYENTGVDILIPGIGMVATACHLSRCLTLNKYDIVLNAGIAGAYRSDFRIGDVVEVTEDCISELGAEDETDFVNVFSLGLADPDEYPYQGGRLFNVYPVKDNPVLGQLAKVRGNTVNTIHSDIRTIERLKRYSGAEIESMEGAAFLYTCLNQKVCNVQIRSISNYVEERDKSKWDLKTAIRILNDILIRFLHNIA
jgi:futalosine hydrolase